MSSDPPQLPLPPPPSPAPQPPTLDQPTNGIGTKRQRRPSVRLGDIGEQPAIAAISSDSHHHMRRAAKAPKIPGSSFKLSSKTRPLTNLEPPEDENVEFLKGIRRGGEGGGGSREGKMRRLGGPISRLVKTNWFSKIEDATEEVAELKSSGGGENFDEEDMVREDSVSPRREQSRIRAGSRELGGRRRVDGAEMDAPSETGGGDWGAGRNGFREDSRGVKAWLNGLGLGRYAPVFEIHEVDEEVLPLLTLEDLKDMGINAVGSRRKMLCSIQKLGKSFG